MRKRYKGNFKIKNPQKYKGNPTNIIYRSLMELRFMKHCDTNDNILKWSSEEIAIPYISPINSTKSFLVFINHLTSSSGDSIQSNTLLNFSVSKS